MAVRLFGREWSRADLIRRVGHIEQIAGIREAVFDDGPARGARLLHVYTGSGFAFDVLPDRGMDISACTFRGMPLAWLSPTGVRHPAFFEPDGYGWLRSFGGGLLATCGLDTFGRPSSDESGSFGQHGRVGNLPAQHVGAFADWEGEDYRLTVSGEVRQARFFGENLVLRRRISTSMGEQALHIEDSVTNEGFAPAPHMILYHFNIGFPMVSEGARLQVVSAQTIPIDDDARAALNEWRHFRPPLEGVREQVFRHMPMAGSDGRVAVELANPDLSLALRLTYTGTTLPYLFQWKMTGEGAYVLGIEPGNCGVMAGRAAARAAGDLPVLAPGERREYSLTIEVSDSL